MAVKQERVGTKDRSKLMARDSRKVLYSAIGFQKGEAGSVSSVCYKLYSSTVSLCRLDDSVSFIAEMELFFSFPCPD
jgi:hypothetical protein